MRARSSLELTLSVAALLAASVACNALFDITEGTARTDAAAGDGDLATGGDGAKGGASGTAGSGLAPSKGGSDVGGSAGKGGGGDSVGGTGETGGTNGSGATGGDTGGSDPGTGGASASGGTDTTGGAGTSGGSDNTGGTGNLGGSDNTGGAGNAGGMGTAGMGMAGMPANPLDAVMSEFEGAIWDASCNADDPNSLNLCLFGTSTPGSCPSIDGGLRVATKAIYGEPGVTYTVRLRAVGSVSSRCYLEGVFDDPNSTRSVHWYVGGHPDYYSFWTSWEMHVKDEDGNEVGVYFPNGAESPYCEQETIVSLDDTITLDVPGGGTIELVIRDKDCEAQVNCNDLPDCLNPVGASTTSLDPKPPAELIEGNHYFDKNFPTGDTNRNPQFLYFDILYKLVRAQ
jgi:hypothetical protein